MRARPTDAADARPTTRAGLTIGPLPSDGGAPGLCVTGELDLDTIDRFDAALDAVLASEPERLVLDLTELRYLGSVALSSLLRARSLVDRVDIRHRGPRIRRTFELAELHRFFVFDDVEGQPGPAASRV